jgi:protein TonB
MTPRWRVGLPLSIALHGALVVAALTFLRVERTPTGLIVDLSAIVAGREDGLSRSTGAPAPPPTSGAAATSRGAAPPARAIASPRATREPASGPASPPPTDTETARHEESTTPPVVRETASPPAAATSSTSSTSIALTTTPDGASGAGASEGAGPGDATPRGSGSGSRSVATEGGESGADGIGTDRTAALGIPGGGGAGSDYAAYWARLRQRIQDAARYPAAARRRGVTGTVHLEIAVDPDGAIGAVSVITSSSHDILDRAAVNAARAIPRVPFPGDVRPRGLRVRLPVVFELQ